MSAVATYWPSITSIMHDSMRPSVDMFGNDVSYFDSQLRRFLMSKNPLPLIVTL